MNINSHVYRMAVIGLSALLVGGLLFSVQPVSSIRAAGQIDLVGPAGSEQFGQNVTVLPNGNIVVADPVYDAGPVVDVGAVYLYSGASGALISMLTGSAAGDKVGDQPVVVLTDGNYVVSSSEWANGGAAKAGAVTWCSAVTGCAGPVSPANSLVGSSANDQVGYSWYSFPSIVALPGGNYVMHDVGWANGSAMMAGAVTWCAAGGGCKGPVSVANSLVGSLEDDQVGVYVEPFANGNYIVRDSRWSNFTGSVTWCDGAGSCNGQVVSAANSLVGSQAGDVVGSERVIVLSNGSYVVGSPYWDNGTVQNAGAVTWCSGSGGCIGQVTMANSLVGSQTEDRVGYFEDEWGLGDGGLWLLDNGSYLVRSSYWDNDTEADAGAVTWCSSAGSCNGQVVSAENSLVGTISDEKLGKEEIIPLVNSNYLVPDRNWGSFRGALTWCSGTVGCSGEASETNSLVDLRSPQDLDALAVLLSNGNYVAVNQIGDNHGVMWCSGAVGCYGTISISTSLTGNPAENWYINSITPLNNGNYVITAPYWDNGATANVGAVTMCGGSGECNGQVVSAANSLVGSSAEDRIGRQILVLKGGAYAVVSSDWNNGSALQAGAVTLCDGQGDCNGAAVTAANSLVGATAGDQIGGEYMGANRSFALKNGGYVVRSPYWQNGGVDVSAVTLCSPTGSCTGQVVSAANSLVGAAYRDLYDNYFTELANGDLVLVFQYWDNDGIVDAGAVTWCSGTEGCHGVVTSANSLVGSKANDRVGLGHSSIGDGDGVIPLGNGSYAVISSYWDNGSAADAGAVTWCSWVSGTCTGDVATANSALGLAPGGGSRMRVAYDSHYNQLVVSRPADNRVTLLRTSSPNQVYLPLLRR